MSSKEWREYRREARGLRKEGQQYQAGITSTRAGYANLSRSSSDSPYNHLHGGAVYGLIDFLYAAASFRLVDEEHRCRFCCEQGILLAEDQIKSTNWDELEEFDAALRGGWWEYIGNFRVVAGLDGVVKAFDTAEEIYLEHDDPEFIAERIHINLDSFVCDIAEIAGYDMGEYEMQFHVTTDPENPKRFTEWVAFQREHVPEFFDAVRKQGWST